MDKRQQNRPPVVTLMGHVDHGKTTLLDAIRKSDVAQKEHGGITQHIGAYQITFQDKKITFVDTPGHAAFEKMRSRGAEVADIVVLVIAATEGIKPQTIEAVKHIKAAKRPIIVAATKIDLPNVNLEKLKKELQGQDITIEEYGGQVPFVPVSAPTGKGIEDLLEIINLSWQMSPQISQPNEPLEAVVIESFLDKSRGPVATLLVKTGTLRVGQKISMDSDVIAVRALIDDAGNQVKEAEPAKPVEVLGFKKTLAVGTVIRDQNYQPEAKAEKSATLEEIIVKSQQSKDNFKVIIKADVAGSLEAILSNLPEKVLIINSGIGEVTSQDIATAKIAHSPIIAFNVKAPSSVQKQADREGIIIKNYKVIYELLEDIGSVVESFSLAKDEAKIVGKGKIIAVFDVEGQKIAGTKITDGKIKTGDAVSIKSGQNIVESKISSIKKFRKEVTSAVAGQDCGIAFENQFDFKEGDIIESLG